MTRYFWANPEHTAVVIEYASGDCVTVCNTDPLYFDIVQDEIEDYRKTEMDFEQLEGLVRLQRNELLKATDWWAVSDRVMSSDELAYRQSLRDITAQPDFPFSIEWPLDPHKG